MDRCSSTNNHAMVYRNMAMDKFRPRMDVNEVVIILGEYSFNFSVLGDEYS